MTSEKARENRARRAADRQGYTLVKSRRRDPRAVDFGTYQLMEQGTDEIVYAARGSRSGYGLTLDEVEEYLMNADPYRRWAHRFELECNILSRLLLQARGLDQDDAENIIALNHEVRALADDYEREHPLESDRDAAEEGWEPVA